MSGVEVLGLVLGIFPLAVSGMEHWRDTKKAASTFRTVRKAYQKDFRNVNYYHTIFALHLRDLLQPLATIDIDGNPDRCAELLQDPGGELWKDAEVTKALAGRLRNCHKPYMDTMEELQDCMIKLAKETKFEDAQFRDLLLVKANTASKTHLMDAANQIVRDTAFQARRLKYSLSSTSREEILQEVGTYIRRLQDLLAAVDRVSNAPQIQSVARLPPIPKPMLHFWKHAERIHQLLRRSMSCSCRAMHCARVWLGYYGEPQANLRLLLLFAKDGHSQQSRPPWSEAAVRVREIEDTLMYPRATTSPEAPSIVLQTTSVNADTPARGAHHESICSPKPISKASRVTFATNSTLPVVPNLLAEGICVVLSKRSQKELCLGSLADESNHVQYDVSLEETVATGSKEMTTAWELLQAGARPVPPFYRAHRYTIALRLAAAQLQFHSTRWFKGQWSVNDIRFSKNSSAEGSLDYSTPYLLADFEAGSVGKTSAGTRDQSLFTLGIVLLELCFGTLLENHWLFKDAAFQRNPADPFQRQAVAYEWAEDVALEADADYALAVKWCLQQAPISSSDGEWRKGFAKNVLQRMQRCCELI